ncbi:MAG: CDP-alcohol phosphatidyltransferase family protein [Candidatus Gastranaerophilales bacterium]|nr:CDP-alcohol phosphatidyltransferase family protein [Candidatus Gastranaerophilales bacterium]
MANIITITRMLLAVIAITLLYFKTPAAYITSFILTIFVIWGDGLDGFVARKFNECSKFGAVLDILGDRIVENIYWIAFATLAMVAPWVPLVVVIRGILTDGIRALALEQGYTAFGETTMMQGKVAKFIVASNFSRFTYAVCKALAFTLMIAAYMPLDYSFKPVIFNAATVCVYISVFFCVVRGLPVLTESKRFFNEKQ